MVATGQNFTLYTGDDKRPEIHVTDTSGEVVDLEGATINWVATKQSDDTEVMSKSTSDGSINITDAEEGKFLIKVDASDTESMDAMTLDHEAEVITSYGLTSHVTVGTIDLKKSKV